MSDLEFVGNLDELSRADKAKVLNKLYAGKYEGWRYEQEIRVNGSREEIDEETGQYFVNFSETQGMGREYGLDKCLVSDGGYVSL